MKPKAYTCSGEQKSSSGSRENANRANKNITKFISAGESLVRYARSVAHIEIMRNDSTTKKN